MTAKIARPIPDRPIRVAVYGAGNFSNTTHLPNLRQLPGVEVVAICDTQLGAAEKTAAAFGIPHVYQDGQTMLANERLDVLYSVVPAFARTDVELTAVKHGLHLFSEKPQALKIQTALAIDAAIRQAGVLSTVSFRERYRPIFQEARRLLHDKQIVHVRFQMLEGPTPASERHRDTWWADFEKSGGTGLDWGVHAVDYTRFMTGLNIVRAQSFYCRRPLAHIPLSWMFNFELSNGGTMALSLVSVSAGAVEADQQPWFTIYYEGGRLALYGYEQIEVNGTRVYQGSAFDPWLEHTRRFIEAVRTGDGRHLLNDYHDGLYSLAPILAGWESARQHGECLDLETFMAAG